MSQALIMLCSLHLKNNLKPNPWTCLNSGLKSRKLDDSGWDGGTEALRFGLEELEDTLGLWSPCFSRWMCLQSYLLSSPCSVLLWRLRRQHSRALFTTSSSPNPTCLHQKDELPLISLQTGPLSSSSLLYDFGWFLMGWRKCSHQQWLCVLQCGLCFTVIGDDLLGCSACVVSGGTLASLCWAHKNRAWNKTIFGVKIWGFKTLLCDIRPANWNFRKNKCT